MNKEYLSVRELTRYIKYKIDNDVNLQEVYIKGEISNFKAHSKGHFYFTIKDETSRINAIMFASSASKVKFKPTDGMKVLVTGKISVYEATGGYQIYVNTMLEDGVGNLFVAFEQLKKKLHNEGLFDSKYKKPIPKIPQKIGVITAPTGAAIRDIISTVNRRFPLAEILVFPSLVQGEGAKENIALQIKNANNYNLDVLIVGRGGGSIEDLWAFNEEIVARAIFDSKIPIVSAVGHEVDFTISDFVSDQRAPTPTGAAEIVVPNMKDVSNYLGQLKLRSMQSMKNILELKKKRLLKVKDNYILNNPLELYAGKIIKFDYLYEKLITNYKNLIEKKKTSLDFLLRRECLTNPVSIIDQQKHQYSILLGKLDALSPLKTLERGYSIVKKDNKAITSVFSVKTNDNITIDLKDGSIKATVK